MDKFIGQLTIEDLACLVRGEGMGSKRVRPGTGCAFGGVSSRLLDFGIPVAARNRRTVRTQVRQW